MATKEFNNLAARRSLFFPSAEIYAEGLAGFFDYGELGVKIRNNIIESWRKNLVEQEGFVEIAGSIILPEKVFEASGHLDSFNDPIIQCKKCHSFFRADKLIEEKTKEAVPESMKLPEMQKLIQKNKINCANCKGELGEIKSFNLMMKVGIGAEGNRTGYLRPETCQTIFLSFDRIYKTARKNLPMGISQVGESFRNEIAPRNQLLRERELWQMESEIFFDPEQANNLENFDSVKNDELNLYLPKNKKITKISCEKALKENIISNQVVAYYLARIQQLYEKLGFPASKLRFRELNEEERAFYAKEAWDLEVEVDGEWIELIANNYRTDYDLKRHAEFSKKELKASRENGEKFVPHVYEISIGLDRTFYCLLALAYRQEKRGPEERVFLDLRAELAPYFVAVFPLVKKDGLEEKGRELAEELMSWNIPVFFDEKGSIGKRYARMDEVGVPYAITLDFDSLKDNTVTLRERTSMAQKRVKIKELPEFLLKLKFGKTAF